MKSVKILYVSMLFKYIFALVFPVCSVIFHNNSPYYIMVAFVELFVIAVFTNLLCGKNKWIGYVFNILAILIMNVQFAILYWSSTFISIVMLTNMDSIEDIGGKFYAYVFSALLVLVFSCLPVCHVKCSKKIRVSVGLGSVILYVAILVTGSMLFSPFYSLYNLVQAQINRSKDSNIVAESMQEDNTDEKKEAEQIFYQDGVEDYIKKPEVLSEKPNVIMIFVEGFSHNIIDDERNIVPNIQKIESESIYFTNYFNHTFATYMGLSGQLYSGYQQNNYDLNYLVSLQDIFKEYGYQTSFINTEPMNKDFHEYLENMNFDQVIIDTGRIDAIADTLSDKSAYELLFETALEQNKEKEPFFLSMYSFGTHATLDGVYEEFEDGSDPHLNKFYDLDVQVGKFFEKFKNSDLLENTIVILTTDHATYNDADFSTAYPEYSRITTVLDKIPLMIYYKGVIPQGYDAGGRNSLDLSPTILDFLDMSGDNYFLGESLFSPVNNSSFFDTYFESLGTCYNTAGAEIKPFTVEETEALGDLLIQYFKIKLDENMDR